MQMFVLTAFALFLLMFFARDMVLNVSQVLNMDIVKTNDSYQRILDRNSSCENKNLVDLELPAQ